MITKSCTPPMEEIGREIERVREKERAEGPRNTVSPRHEHGTAHAIFYAIHSENNITITVSIQNEYWGASCKRNCGQAINEWSACCQSNEAKRLNVHSWASQPCVIFLTMDVRVGTDVCAVGSKKVRRNEFFSILGG